MRVHLSTIIHFHASNSGGDNRPWISPGTSGSFSIPLTLPKKYRDWISVPEFRFFSSARGQNTSQFHLVERLNAAPPIAKTSSGRTHGRPFGSNDSPQ